MDIPLDDPEANRAAAKIQAGFRGHMTRKKLKPEDKTEGEERQEDRGQQRETTHLCQSSDTPVPTWMKKKEAKQGSERQPAYAGQAGFQADLFTPGVFFQHKLAVENEQF